ncbi:hypothetical protein EDD71_105139 [Fonticella tunisiensis]|uniref:Uncharacterized protein n=1 Tax=Fonticella tunisiensis TaxID=1096341 RepID=A0A4V3EUZ8_9CLOT|nr:hypothetical protein EDD71_105139 [Fonticella tunisiensis]
MISTTEATGSRTPLNKNIVLSGMPDSGKTTKHYILTKSPATKGLQCKVKSDKIQLLCINRMY